MIDALSEYQNAILRIVSQTEQALTSGRVPDATEVAKGRWELVRALASCGHFKHQRLFDPVILRGTTDEVANAQKLKANCLKISADIRRHVSKWTTLGICDWENYRTETLIVMKAIRVHLNQEARGVATLPTPDELARRTSQKLYATMCANRQRYKAARPANA